MNAIRTLTLAFAALLLATPACKSSRRNDLGPPGDVADRIAAHLDAGQFGHADEEFAKVKSSQHHRDVVYSVVYHRAARNYEAQNYEGADHQLRFLIAHYPDAAAPREALLYTLFLERTTSRKAPDAGRLQEMERLAHEVKVHDKNAPAWVDLVSAQIAIDRNRLASARTSFARFRARWDGRPASLQDYVTRMDRFLARGEES